MRVINHHFGTVLLLVALILSVLVNNAHSSQRLRGGGGRQLYHGQKANGNGITDTFDRDDIKSWRNRGVSEDQRNNEGEYYYSEDDDEDDDDDDNNNNEKGVNDDGYIRAQDQILQDLADEKERTKAEALEKEIVTGEVFSEEPGPNPDQQQNGLIGEEVNSLDDDDGDVDDETLVEDDESFVDDDKNDGDVEVEGTNSPTNSPTKSATGSPTSKPIQTITLKTSSPTTSPTLSPTVSPTASPTALPTLSPIVSIAITNSPTKAPIEISTKFENDHNTEQELKEEKISEEDDFDDDDDEQEEDDDDIVLVPSSTTKEESSSPPTPSPNSIKDEDPSEMFENLPEEEKEYIEHKETIDEEKTAAKISIGFIFLTLALMICTAQQMGENPDGVYANICRLAITVTSCIFKMFLFPFRKVFGFGTGGYAHHLVTTQEFRDPYTTNRSDRMQFL